MTRTRQLRPAQLADLGTINAVKLWLEPFKFVGIARDMRRAGLYSKGQPVLMIS
jgi:hypothetical protein